MKKHLNVIKKKKKNQTAPAFLSMATISQIVTENYYQFWMISLAQVLFYLALLNQPVSFYLLCPNGFPHFFLYLLLHCFSISDWLAAALLFAQTSPSFSSLPPSLLPPAEPRFLLIFILSALQPHLSSLCLVIGHSTFYEDNQVPQLGKMKQNQHTFL